MATSSNATLHPSHHCAVLALLIPDTHDMSMLDMEFSMATNVHLTPGPATFARTCVESGHYNNAGEVSIC